MTMILQELLKGKVLSSSDWMYSNTNQYFNDLKKRGIELVEVWKPNKTNKGKHKERKLYQSIENIRNAEKLLKQLRGVNI